MSSHSFTLICRSGNIRRNKKKSSRKKKEKGSGDLPDPSSEYIILLLECRQKQGRTRIRERDDARRW
jgi:hypothetical protein